MSSRNSTSVTPGSRAAALASCARSPSGDPGQVRVEQAKTVSATSRGDQDQLILLPQAQRPADLLARQSARAARDVSAILHLGCAAGWEAVLARRVEYLPCAENKDPVVELSDENVIAVALPGAPGHLGAVQDVAQDQHVARARVVPAQ